jgi:hypothetical protein
MAHHHWRWVHQCIHASLLTVITCVLIWLLGASGSVQQIPQPRPVEAALILLRWSPAETPIIIVVDMRPQDVSVLAEAWTFFCTSGCSQPTIYVAAWSELYRKALANPFDLQRTIRLAGVLAHERAHLRHGPDEEFAYDEQLRTLAMLQASDLDITNVQRALREALKRQGRRH